jgi:hypothetical protein
MLKLLTVVLLTRFRPCQAKLKINGGENNKIKDK